MTNTQVQFGFREYATIDGINPTYGNAIKKIAAGNAVPIFKNDPVTQLSTGYIAQSVAGTTQIEGIFIGCKYLSASQGRTVYNSYWPGTDAIGDVEAYVINNPFQKFVVASIGGPLVFANVGNNVNFSLAVPGVTATGISGAVIDFATVAVTATLPFRIFGLYSDVAAPGENGSDNTTTFNWAIVGFNNQTFKSNTGI